MDLLPLIFLTALVAYVLIVGKGRGARAARLVCIFVVFACLIVWAYGFFTYGQGQSALTRAIDGFYATAYLRESLGPLWAGFLMLLLQAGPAIFIYREFRRRR